MATVIETRRVKCVACKKAMLADTKIDIATHKVLKYMRIAGGARTALFGYNATYCDSCISKYTKQPVCTNRPGSAIEQPPRAELKVTTRSSLDEGPDYLYHNLFYGDALDYNELVSEGMWENGIRAYEGD